MKEAVFERMADFIWPRLAGSSDDHTRQEHEKLTEETTLISKAADALRSDESQLGGYLAACEKLFEAEGSRKSSIEARLLSIAGLVSIAGTVVLGALFSLATEKLTFGSPIAKFVLSAGCLYLTIQLVAALHASVRGLRATGYVEDQPHERLPIPGATKCAYLLRRIKQVLVRVAEHRQVNNGKLDQLNIAHVALHNFLWGLLGVAVVTFIVAQLPMPSLPISAGRPPAVGRVLPEEGLSQLGFGQPVFLISAGMSLFTLGVALFAFSTTTSRRVLAAAMTASGLGLTLLGTGKLDATLFKIDKLIGELRFEVSVGAKGNRHHAFIRRVVTVGPFPDGDHLLADTEVANCISLALEKYKGTPIGGWEVVGRVDKRQLRPDRAKVYGSNQALAMARASWVAQRAMATQSSFDLAHAVVSVGGARGIGASVGGGDLESDRAVDVFAVVNAGLNEKGAADLPGPVVCPRPSAPK